MTPSSARRLSSSRLYLIHVLWLSFLSVPLHAQQNSGAAAITLTAVLQQSLTMSVTPAGLVSARSNWAHAATVEALPLDISSRWVAGPARVTVSVLAASDPSLGAQAWVPVDFTNAWPSNQTIAAGLRINSGEPAIPPGAASGALTIRAQAF